MNAGYRAIVIASLVLGMAAQAPKAQSADDAPTPLFASDDELEITLRLPLKRLLRQRSQGFEVEGALLVTGAATARPLDVEIRPRGHKRLEICAFPPLRLNFRRSQVADTAFAGQDRLKLVTLCRDSESHERYLELEYLVYRMYQQVAEAAFRVRWSSMRYMDSERDDAARAAPAFFLEPIGGVAERLGLRAVAVPSLRLEQLDPRALARLAVFQFMIGNTDWAVTQPTLGEDACCHNGDVLARPGNPGSFVIVPFDFDHAGIVDADYAKPDERLGIRSVRERLYRGFCAANGYVDETIAAFNAARPAIEALLEERPLAPETRAAAASYLAESYDILNHEHEKQRQILDRCLGR
jgi:hypothetical protein